MSMLTDPQMLLSQCSACPDMHMLSCHSRPRFVCPAGSVAALSQQAQAFSLKYGNLAEASEGPGPYSNPR